jgi:hypothetical protein
MTILRNFINANDGKGRDYICSAEGANNIVVNLSGKRTLVGRNSGERFILQEATKGESLRVNFQVQGQRPSQLLEGVFCPFVYEFLSPL